AAADGETRVLAYAGPPLGGHDLDDLAGTDVAARAVLEKDELSAVADIAEAVDGGITGLPGVGPVLSVPFAASAATRGALTLGWSRQHEDRFHTLDAQLVATYAEQAALSLQLAEAREDQRRLAVLEDRDRIGRDLHDLVIQRLFAVGLGLQGTVRLVERPEVGARIEQAVDDLDATIKDIRRAIFGLSSLETEGDVQVEVTRLVDRAAATLKFRPSLRFEGPVRTLIPPAVVPDLLAVLAEGLSNASRHAEATHVEVVVEAAERITLSVSDNGRGISGAAAESGLANIRARAEQRGGSLEISSEPGEGTTLVWSVTRS
ncbi:MAG TPA: ATP-binding protein, partial [Nocardioides sp.]|nr:ATP-binding protein [Nocardioides sp.]